MLPPPRLHPCRRDDQRAQPPAGHHAGRHQADDRQGEIEQKCQQSQSLKSWKKRNTVSLKLNEAIMSGERYPLSLFSCFAGSFPLRWIGTETAGSATRSSE